MKSMDKKLPEAMSSEELKEKGASRIKESTYFSIVMGNMMGVYQPDYASKNDRGKYTRYTRRSTVFI